MKNDAVKTALIAAAGSALLLIGAWGFQALGYAPCKLCIWQRYPHVVAILLGICLLFGLRNRLVYLFGALAAVTTGGIGVYHTGIERDWWEGPTSCSGSGFDMSSMTGADLLSTMGESTVVMCDEVAWQFLTLSMASWNAAFSFSLMGLWIIALALSKSKQSAAIAS